MQMQAPSGHLSPLTMVDANGHPVPQFYFASMPQQQYQSMAPPGFYSTGHEQQQTFVQHQQQPTTPVMYSSDFPGQPQFVYMPAAAPQVQYAPSPYGYPGGPAFFHPQQPEMYPAQISAIPSHVQQAHMGQPMQQYQPQPMQQQQQQLNQSMNNGTPVSMSMQMSNQECTPQQQQPPTSTSTTTLNRAAVLPVPPPPSSSSSHHHDSASHRPLSTSTPLPQEFSQIPPPFTNQMPRQDNIKSAYLNYHRHMDEDVLANLSRISTVSEVDELDQSRYSEHSRRFVQVPMSTHGHPMPMAINIVRRPSIGTLSHMAYKTRLCSQYHRNGHCAVGTHCRFAHGSDELRPPNLTRAMMNPKYKTKLCKNHLQGGNNYCPYGTRCEFIHPGDAEYESAVAQSEYPLGDSSLSSCQNDVTPQLPVMPPPATVTKSAFKEKRYEPSESSKPSGRRGVARSMTCLASAQQRKRDNYSDDSAIGSGSYESHEKTQLQYASQRNLTRRSMTNIRGPSVLPPAPPSSSCTAMPLKFVRRRSMSQLSLNKKWNSTEELAEMVENWNL